MADLITNGWFSFAQVHPGPAFKVHPEVNQCAGWVCHSMEGWWATNDTLKNPDRGSWHGTILLTGELIQHYSIFASPWASGNKQANTRYDAWELEGTAARPMNDFQLATAQRMQRAWVRAGLPSLIRKSNLWNHNEVATMWQPNAGPTACPSDRWDPFYEWLAAGPKSEEEEMAAIEEMREELRQEIARLESKHESLNKVVGAHHIRLNQVETDRDIEVDRRRLLDNHLINHPGSGAGNVPKHIHAPVPSGQVIEAKG